MAIYNEILAGRYARLLQKIFGMKGQNPAKQLSGEIMPVFPFFSGVEHRWPESWLVYQAAKVVSSVAGQFGFVQLRNPLGSGVIAVVHKVTISEGAADNPAISITNAAQADGTVANIFGLDSRNTGSSSLVFSSATQAANPNLSLIIYQSQMAANAPLEVIQDAVCELPILPGLTMRFSAQTVNQNFTLTVGWRERPIEDSEKF